MKHTCFIIVTLIVLESIFDMTESFVCKPPSVYHNHTGTCVRFVREKLAYVGARSFCANNFKGDLVFIYDSETSHFIKELLRTWDIQEALIGLQNALLFEQYKWGENQQPQSVTYFDWAAPSYVEDKNKRAVVATADGWRKHDFYTPADFICQSATVLPELVMSCPIAKEGKQNHSLWCNVDTYETTQNATIQLCRKNKLPCPNFGYTTSYQTYSSNVTAQLNISSVRRKDEGIWTCFISFTVSSGTHDMNKSCDLLVYSIPQTPTCQHTSNDTHVLVTCSTSKVYPEAKCKWEETFGIDQIKVLPESTQHRTYKLYETVYDNTTCTASFRPDVTGVFKIVVTMFANYSQPTQGVTQEHNITIGPPDCPSQFDIKLINNDSVIISWTPGHNGGLTQTFVFYSHTNTSLDRTLVATVVDDNNKSMVYIVRNLHMNMSLVFSVDVKNILSTIVCPDLNVSVNVSDVSGHGIPEKQNGSVLESRLTLYLVMASLGVVLPAALLAIVVVRFRRQHSYNRKTCKHKKSKAETEVLNNLYGLQDIKLYCNNT